MQQWTARTSHTPWAPLQVHLTLPTSFSSCCYADRGSTDFDQLWQGQPDRDSSWACIAYLSFLLGIYDIPKWTTPEKPDWTHAHVHITSERKWMPLGPALVSGEHGLLDMLPKAEPLVAVANSVNNFLHYFTRSSLQAGSLGGHSQANLLPCNS